MVQFAQGGFPASFEFRGHQPIIGIAATELAVCQMGRMPQPFDLLRLGLEQAVAAKIGFPERAGREIDVRDGERLEEALQHR